MVCLGKWIVEASRKLSRNSLLYSRPITRIVSVWLILSFHMCWWDSGLLVGVNKAYDSALREVNGIEDSLQTYLEQQRKRLGSRVRNNKTLDAILLVSKVCMTT